MLAPPWGINLLKRVDKSRKEILNRVPIRLITKTAEITTTTPIIPFTIFCLAPSSFCLSLPAVIIPIAPVMNVNTNHINATIVKRPIADEMMLVNVPIPFGFAKIPVPIPLNPPGGAMFT